MGIMIVKVKEIKEKYAKQFMLAKHLFALFFPILAVSVNRFNIRYLWVAAAETALIAVITQVLYRFGRRPGHYFNVAALAFLNSQYGLLFWGSSFLSMAMLDNMDSVNALSGKAVLYILTIVVITVFTAMPTCRLDIGRNKKMLTGGIVLAINIAVHCICGAVYSPFYGYISLIQQQISRGNIANRVNTYNNETGDTDSSTSSGSDDGAEESENKDSEFYSPEISNYIEKPDELSETPNVILVFIEGCSENIIEDARNIMPNLAEIQDRSISFSDYYNHTFATYMGISGQLYSGYQQNNYDENKLISIQDVFKNYGYNTAMINTEPNNTEFSDYLENFRFDEVITDTEMTDGEANSLSDRSAYELLLETALEKNEEDEPFFLAMYSFGTHASFDGVYNKFGDGSNALLNRFYDLDVQIGEFIEAFEESDLAENTVIIFTADHATYQDTDFNTAFPDYERTVTTIDRIPLMIYYEGVEPETYNADGRNSLDMVPTVLDFLDMDTENYFLGDSLFAAENNSMFDTYYESVGSYYGTAGGEVAVLDADEIRGFEQYLAEYFALKLSDYHIYEEYESGPHVYVSADSENKIAVAELDNAEEWDEIYFAVWSSGNGQEDIQWFTKEGVKEEHSIYEIDMSGFDGPGTYSMHVYASMNGDEGKTWLTNTGFIMQ